MVVVWTMQPSLPRRVRRVRGPIHRADLGGNGTAQIQFFRASPTKLERIIYKKPVYPVKQLMRIFRGLMKPACGTLRTRLAVCTVRTRDRLTSRLWDHDFLRAAPE